MPVLVRWAGPTGEVTIRSTSLTQHPFLQGMVVLVGVRGVNDPEHPDVEVHTLTLRQADLRYVAHGEDAAAVAPKVEPVGVDAQTSVNPPRRRAQA